MRDFALPERTEMFYDRLRQFDGQEKFIIKSTDASSPKQLSKSTTFEFCPGLNETGETSNGDLNRGMYDIYCGENVEAKADNALDGKGEKRERISPKESPKMSPIIAKKAQVQTPDQRNKPKNDAFGDIVLLEESDAELSTEQVKSENRFFRKFNFNCFLFLKMMPPRQSGTVDDESDNGCSIQRKPDPFVCKINFDMNIKFKSKSRMQ